MKVTFSNTARSERHFTAMLLPHLLLANNYSGMRALFRSIESFDGTDFDTNDIEIVAELNPIRDLGDAESRRRKQSVPDLFLRCGQYVILIEAKFFTFPTAKAVVDQMKAQLEAVRSVLAKTKYEDCSIHSLALTVHELANFSRSVRNMSHMTWHQVISILEPAVSAANSRDMDHVLADLKNSIRRSEGEQTATGNVEEGRCKSIQALLQRAPELLSRRQLYVGFEGGMRRLRDSTIESLEERGHYKYSSRKPNPNWLLLKDVISHYLELKTHG